jgi:hypothetical protein
VCVLGLIAAGTVDAHAQPRVLRGDSDRVDIATPHGTWTGVGETPREGHEIKGNFIAPDGSLRHCILHTDGQGTVLFSECP